MQTSDKERKKEVDITKWKWDLFLDDFGESFFSVEELLKQAEECLNEQKYDACHSFLLRASASSLGKLHLAKFYMLPGSTNMSLEESRKKAKCLLYDIEDKSSEACYLLSSCYEVEGRYAGALAWLLKSRRESALEINRYVKKIKTMDVDYQWPYDFYLCGKELAARKKDREAIVFLKIACSYEQGTFVALAADLIAALSSDPAERRFYSQVAEKNGFSQLLRKE